MNQEKIGKLISLLRKEKGYTQQDLANILGVTDKAVSKWERGLGCPDMSLLIPISEIFGITTNELLLGERLKNREEKENMEKWNKEVLTYTSNEIKKTKRKNKRITIILFVISIILFMILSLFLVKYYREEREEQQLNNYISRLEKNLKELNFKKDTPLRSPNFVLTMDDITYVVPRITYRGKKAKTIYKEILSYSNYDTFIGLILYYNGEEFSITNGIEKEEDDGKRKYIQVACDLEGNLIGDHTVEELNFYKENKEEIEERMNQLRMIWINIYEDQLLNHLLK